MLIFKCADITDKGKIDKYIVNSHNGCENTAANFIMWRCMYETSIYYDEKYAILRTRTDCKTSYSFMAEKKDYEKAVNRILEECMCRNIPFRIQYADENMKNELEKLFPDYFMYEHDRNYSDYVYLQSDLAMLAGKKFHAKRNHCNKFLMQYPNAVVEEINDGNKAECCEMNENWCKINNVDSENAGKVIRHEFCAVKEGFDHFDELGLFGICVRIDGKIVAFTMGSEKNSEMFVTHFEKGYYEYDGVYAFINREMAKRLDKYKYINREEDCGEEGLRKAKISYNQVYMIDKYVVTLKK